jgi:5-methylcytosine-specific restriction enzyme A
MRPEALFINGVYEDVLQEIAKVQSLLPEQILFLQPYAGGAISKLRDDTPSVEAPMWLLLSTTTDLPTVRYVAQVVGWEDKRTLSEGKRDLLNRIIKALQPGETGLYDASKAEGGESVNLLHVRRLRKLRVPFSVEQLIKVSDGQPVSAGRTTAGGWVYVRASGLDPLLGGQTEGG